MADPLSIAGSVVGVISLGIQITQSLVDFYNTSKYQDSDLRRTTEKLQHLLDIFHDLETTMSSRKLQAGEGDLRRVIEASIKNCDSLIRELWEECEKFKDHSSTGIKAAVKSAGRRVAYPYRQSTLQKLDEDVGDILANLSSALTVLQLKDNKRTHDEISEMKSLLESISNYQISSDLRDWLNAPDATIEHNAACLKKYPGTGVWLIENPHFSSWLTKKNSFLWLNGFAGSGKSVLCSTAIQAVLYRRRADRGVGIAFFYFTFNDESKQDQSSLLRALILQFSTQLQDGHVDLRQLHSSYETSTPPPRVLMDYLRRLIERFQDTYVLVDALDESPQNRQRGYVLEALEVIASWGIQGLHLLVTSRDEIDIRESFTHLSMQEIQMRNSGIDKDIADYISGRFNIDRRLRKWFQYREKIQEALVKRAEGMFRWVDSQFESLRSCPRSEAHLNRLLNSLPQSLDETYERMLCNISDDLIEDARRVLTLLCFASRPLTVRELIDAVAIEITICPGLNRKRRLHDADDFRTICSGLIDIGTNAIDFIDSIHGDSVEISDDEASTQTVRIAHFSIQEYLESRRIQNSKAAIFALNKTIAHSEIARICLVYLLEPGLPLSMLESDVLRDYPLAHYAAKYWYYHFQRAKNVPSEVDKLVLSIFQNKESHETCVKLYDPDRPWSSEIDFTRASDQIASPIYYASLVGLDRLLRDLTSTEHPGNMEPQATVARSSLEVSQMINARGGFHDTALMAASIEGHENIVQLLLDRGAEVNAEGGKYGFALQATSFMGQKNVVQLLRDRGEEVNAKGGAYGFALQAASFMGHDKIVQLLLDRGADVNAKGGAYGFALQAASSTGHEKIVQLLLDQGAEINAQRSGDGCTALYGTSYMGQEKIVQLLLDRGAEVNIQCASYGNALQAAQLKGHQKVAQLLIDRGAMPTKSDREDLITDIA